MVASFFAMERPDDGEWLRGETVISQPKQNTNQRNHDDDDGRGWQHYCGGALSCCSGPTNATCGVISAPDLSSKLQKKNDATMPWRNWSKQPK